MTKFLDYYTRFIMNNIEKVEGALNPLIKENLSSKQLFEILQNTNLSKFVGSSTQKGKIRLNNIIDTDEMVKGALIYIIDNYKKQRKNNPDKFGWMHCIEVASLMAEYGFCESDEIAAALLHDVWEDIPNGGEYLKSTYNENIVSLVQELTEKDKSGDSLEQKKLSREDRKLEEMEKISHFSPQILALKLADQTSNIAETVNDLENLSPEDRKKYWEGFNAGYDKQIWKYRTLRDIIGNRIQACKDDGLFLDEKEKMQLDLFFKNFTFLVDRLDSIMKEV